MQLLIQQTNTISQVIEELTKMKELNNSVITAKREAPKFE